jgi:hypothetical protein
VACGERGAEVPVGHDAAGHRMQYCDVYAAPFEQLLRDQFGM